MKYRRRWYFLGFIIALFVVLFQVREFRDALALWQGFSWQWIIAAACFQLISYTATAHAFKKLVARDQFIFSLGYFFKTVTIVNAINRTMPTFGLSGGAYMVAQLHARGMSKSTAVLSVLLYYFNLYIAFCLVLIVAMTMLWLQYDITTINIIVSLLALGLVLGLFGCIFFVLSKLERSIQWTKRLLTLLCRIHPKVKLYFTNRQVSVLDEVKQVYTSWQMYLSDFRQMVYPLCFVVFQHMADIMTLWCIFQALLSSVPIGILAVGFVSASVLSFISLIPNGLGVYETSLVVLLNAFGVSLTVSLSGVLAFRALFFWLPLPFGMYFYSRRSAKNSSIIND